MIWAGPIALGSAERIHGIYPGYIDAWYLLERLFENYLFYPI
jgi:hypothetical protein